MPTRNLLVQMLRMWKDSIRAALGLLSQSASIARPIPFISEMYHAKTVFRSRTIAGVMLTLCLLVSGGWLFGDIYWQPGSDPVLATGSPIVVTHSNDSRMWLFPDEDPVAFDAAILNGDDPDGAPKGIQRDWFWKQRAYPLNTIPFGANHQALQRARGMVRASGLQATWVSIGPAPIAEGGIGYSDSGTLYTETSGRVKAIAFDPTNSDVMYVATASGGLWKSTNGGDSFTALDTGEIFFFYSLSIDPNNPETIYAGTGELGMHYGFGLLKSTDGGQSWVRLGSAEFGSLVLTSIAINPQDSRILYVSTANFGSINGPTSPPLPAVWKSLDGGSTWQNMLSCGKPCSVGFTDLVMNDVNPNLLYAAVGDVGIYKTVDGGIQWEHLSGFDTARGRQASQKTELAIGSGGGADVLYAGIDGSLLNNGRVEAWGLLFRSLDAGQNWTWLANTPNYCANQCWYDNIIAVDPQNPSTVYIGGMLTNASHGGWAGVVYRSTNAGESWQDLTPGTSVAQMIHPDMHAIAFDPQNSSIVWAGNDGGVYRYANGEWSARNQGLNTTQFVGLAAHPTNPEILFGGMQDNAHAHYDGSTWRNLITGDGGHMFFDPFDVNMLYTTFFNRAPHGVSFTVLQGSTIEEMRSNYHADVNNGTRNRGIELNDPMEFYVPIVVDKKQPGVIYVATNKVYRTNDRGANWVAISDPVPEHWGNINALAIAPSDPRYIYAGTTFGWIMVGIEEDNGWNWFNITKDTLPDRFIKSIAVSPTDVSVIYLAFNGFSSNTPDAPGHLFKTADFGDTWSVIDGTADLALPDIPVSSMLLDPFEPGGLYAGTDIGVFESNDDGQTWTYNWNGAAPVPVTNLLYNSDYSRIWASTYGRGVYYLPLNGQIPTPEATPTNLPTATPLPQPTPTPTLPPEGIAPGQWAGDLVDFGIASDQSTLYGLRAYVDASGNCGAWLQYDKPITVAADGTFSVLVEDRTSAWGVEGIVAGQDASGAGVFFNIDPGSSVCGSAVTDSFTWSARWSNTVKDPTAVPTSVPPTPTPTPEPASGIRGQVLAYGEGIANIAVSLIRCTAGAECDPKTGSVRQTRTTSGGFYDFIDAPSLKTDEFYYVYYLNNEDGGNASNDLYLYSWGSVVIENYAAGSVLEIESFDIAELLLQGPNDGEVEFPIEFTWSTRSGQDEKYVWRLYDKESSEVLCSSAAVAAGSFSLTDEYIQNNCEQLQLGIEYVWWVWAVNGTDPDVDPSGDSYYLGTIKLSDGISEIYLPVILEDRPLLQRRR